MWKTKYQLLAFLDPDNSPGGRPISNRLPLTRILLQQDDLRITYQALIRTKLREALATVMSWSGFYYRGTTYKLINCCWALIRIIFQRDGLSLTAMPWSGLYSTRINAYALIRRTIYQFAFLSWSGSYFRRTTYQMLFNALIRIIL